MNFQIGDLIITKDNRNRKVITYITGIHKAGEDKDEIHYWVYPSITIQYSPDHWTRLPIKTIEAHLNEPFKPARWYHYPVVK